MEGKINSKSFDGINPVAKKKPISQTESKDSQNTNKPVDNSDISKIVPSVAPPTITPAEDFWGDSRKPSRPIKIPQTVIDESLNANPIKPIVPSEIPAVPAVEAPVENFPVAKTPQLENKTDPAPSIITEPEKNDKNILEDSTTQSLVIPDSSKPLISTTEVKDPSVADGVFITETNANQTNGGHKRSFIIVSFIFLFIIILALVAIYVWPKIDVMSLLSLKSPSDSNTETNSSASPTSSTYTTIENSSSPSSTSSSTNSASPRSSSNGIARTDSNKYIKPTSSSIPTVVPTSTVEPSPSPTTTTFPSPPEVEELLTPPPIPQD